MTNSGGKRTLATVALGGAIVLAASAASALHPGDTHSGDVPQGPEWFVCDNEGWNGIEVAISVDGMVHCEPLPPPPPPPPDGGVE